MSTNTVTAVAPVHRLSARDIALAAVFAGVTAALGFIPAIPIPLSPVPITAQTLGVMIAGAVLGWKLGFLSQLLFQALVLIGLPLLSGGRGGLAVLSGATVGFFLAFSLAALLIGWATQRFNKEPYAWWKGIIIHVIFGMFFVDIIGIAGMMVIAKLSLGKAIVAGVVPYLVGDTLKAAIAALIAAGVHKAYPGLLK
ncbi:MAG: biotin transporter BioY [Propionibacteriaceae bacterium]|jgi:biotin transport system substrate-specific component|nr:biotin transporter BioY [Propionibacteriaceae bacterium]